jgi:hypothetical protein
LYEYKKQLLKLAKQPTDLIKLKDEKTSELVKAFEEYRLSEFLIKNGYDLQSIIKLLEKHSGKEAVPYSIALLCHIGYFDYFKDNFCSSKAATFAKWGEIFKAPSRRIKGNINIIVNDNSDENATQYTSHKYIPTIEKELKGLL